MSKKAPWTDTECVALNHHQARRDFHPFTCGSGNRSDDAHVDARKRLNLTDNGALIATRNGWVCAACDYTQDWAHEFMFGKIAP